jgi:hypothetical protein
VDRRIPNTLTLFMTKCGPECDLPKITLLSRRRAWQKF